MLISEIIRAKRDGQRLTAEQIAEFVAGITDETATDAQISALAMAVFFNGMDRDETIALTMAMRNSGDVLDWSDLDRPVADKHSTGGVGDNVSLMLAPMAASCGLAVPMISGRGLGHTGGTLDKMDAIPGYISQPDNALFRKVTREVGCAIIGQTANLAPADKRFYAIRDVTATVENLSLITASILSKKLAAGLGALVLDVKFGSGAFMAKQEDSIALAESLVAVANGAGTKTTALLTDMNQPLASAAGNGVEVANAVEFLTGHARDLRLEDVTVALVADMLVSSGLQQNQTAAQKAARESLTSGKAAQIFGQMIATLGGPNDFVENYQTYLPSADHQIALTASADGFVSAIDTRAIGIAVVEMGGGRRKRDDIIDHAVGLTNLVPIGTKVAKGDPLAIAHLRTPQQAAGAQEIVAKAYQLSEHKPPLAPLMLKRIDATQSPTPTA